MKVHDKVIEERILERTAALISRLGLKGWNMDVLAADVGLAKNTLYKIINSKEELVERVAIRNVKKVQLRLAEIVEGEGDYLDVLKNLIREFPLLLQAVRADSMREIFLEYPAVEKRVKLHQDELTDRIIGFIGEGIEAGFLRSNVTAEFIFDLLRAIVIFQIRSGAVGDALSKKVELSFECLFFGLKV